MSVSLLTQPTDLVSLLKTLRLRANLDDGSARFVPLALPVSSDRHQRQRRTYHRERIPLTKLQTLLVRFEQHQIAVT